MMWYIVAVVADVDDFVASEQAADVAASAFGTVGSVDVVASVFVADAVIAAAIAAVELAAGLAAE